MIREQFDNDKGLKVFKTHHFTKAFAKEFENNNALGVYIYRDVRDVFVSAMRKRETSFKELWKTKFIDEILTNYEGWTQLPNMLISQYETMRADLGKEVARIAAHLNITIDEKECQEIATLFSLDNQRKRINKLKATLQEQQTPIKRKSFDQKELLHVNHIFGGRVGDWRTLLHLQQIALIEERSDTWLKAHNYPLESVKINRLQKWLWKITQL